MRLIDRILPYHVVFGVEGEYHGAPTSRHFTRRGAERTASDINELMPKPIRPRYFVVRA